MAQPGRCVGRGLEHCLGSLAQIGKGHEFKSRPGLHDSSTPVLVTLLFDFSGDGLNRRLGSILVFHERAIPRAFFGETPVVAQLAIGIEQLILFITKARIIVAHFGKMGAGGACSSLQFGRLSGGFARFKSPSSKTQLPILMSS